MKLRIFLICVVASVLLGTEAFAQNEGTRWAAANNDRMYSDLLKYMGTFQSELVGEEAYYIVQDAMMAVKAAHTDNPYKWIGQICDLCLRLESIYPAYISHPTEGKSDRYEKIRRGILRIWDFPAHVVSSKNSSDLLAPPQEQIEAFSNSIMSHLRTKREVVFDFLAMPRPADDEIQLIKVYSSGFILRTKNSCIAFDICYNYAFGDGLRLDEFVGYLDAVCFTHTHNDHFDSTLASTMAQAGKAVVMYSDLIPAYPSSSKVIWPVTQETMVQIAPGIKGCAQMSQQGSDPCLLYYIDIDGWRVIHNGDNDDHNKDVFFESRDRADIIFCDFFGSWNRHMKHFMAAPNTENISTTYITTHGNEYHHPVSGRIGYHYLYYASDAFGCKDLTFPNYVGMDNAELVILKK